MVDASGTTTHTYDAVNRPVSITQPNAAVAGYPNINVTGGYLYGLPVGVSFFGRAWSEPTLLKIAYAFEQLTKARQKPMFLPSIPLKAKY